MTEMDRELVRKIAERVLAELAKGGAGGPAGAAGGAKRAAVRPPVGVCTGDYSKFPELVGKLQQAGKGAGGGAMSESDAGAAGAGEAGGPLVGEPMVLTGIITASQLQAAMDAAGDKVAVLAAEARLTPLAADLARQLPKRVRRMAPGSTAAASGGGGGAAGGGLGVGAWAWWMQGRCAAVEELANQRRGRLRLIGASRSDAAMEDVVRTMAGAVKGKQVVGGLLFVPSAAKAVCLANRCAALRAVVGTCGEAVEQGISELGANVLVIEYPHVGPEAMTAMVDRMMSQKPKAPPQVERQLADLGRC